jgi:hypothetical protein
MRTKSASSSQGRALSSGESSTPAREAGRFSLRSCVSWHACGGALVLDLAPVVQRPQHGDVGHHNNAALLGGRDQAFHGNLPMLALGLGRAVAQ